MAKKNTATDKTSTLPSAPADSPVGQANAPAKRRTPARRIRPRNAPAIAADAAPIKGSNGKAPQVTTAEIAEAAYYRHLKRGGAHGDEFNDWLEAERELKDRRH